MYRNSILAFIHSSQMTDKDDISDTDSFKSMEVNSRPKSSLKYFCQNILEFIVEKFQVLLSLIVLTIISLVIGSLVVQNQKLEKLVQNHQQKFNEHGKKMNFSIQAASAESCAELFAHGIKISGIHYIDPDGRYEGLPAFVVFCDFVRNVTKIQPLSKNMEAPNVIKYSPTMEQSKALRESMGSCYQEITFNCSVQTIERLFWVDFKGKLSDTFE